MEENSLRYLLLSAIKDEHSPEVYLIIEKFDPILNKYARQLEYDCAKTDLIIFLIELIRKSTIEVMARYEEGQLVNFFVRALRNKRVDLYRKNSQKFTEIHTEEILAIEDNFNFVLDISLQQCIAELTEQQRKVILGKYIDGYSDKEIANQMNISRQAVNRLKTRALESLKVKLEE